MAAVYKQFLAAPNSSLLAENATLHYVATTISVTGATAIIKHFNTLQKQVKIKKQDVLNTIEGQGAAVFEIDTALEFKTSGGSYLPGLDDNFISDRTAFLAIVCIQNSCLTTSVRIWTQSSGLIASYTDAHCRFRCRWQDCADTPAVGPGVTPQAA